MNIKIVQRKDRIYADGRSPLFFRFTQKRQCKYISTGIALTQEFWNETEQRITESCPDSESLNWQLKEKLAEYQKQIDKLTVLEIEVSFDTLFGQKSRYINCTVSEYFQQQIDYLRNIGKVGLAVKYTSCKHLLEQCGLGRKRFEQVDLQYLQDFEAFLIRKGNTSNSIATKFSVLRAVYNKAVKHKVFAETENPFKQYNVGRFWKPTRKRAITKEDVQRIQSLELPASTEVYSTAFARDIFLFSYCVAGINFKDIATLRYGDIQNGRIYYQRHKTGKELNSPILPQTKKIMDRYSKPDASSDDYIFPILDRHIHKSEQQICNRVHKVIGHVNANLKRIAEMAGLKVNLTTYVARHTFATVLKRSGVNIAIISESLGHSDLETTQIYLDSFENSQIDEAMKNLL
ncbi:MAG TPA: site-specific integrase [Candidatus Coprenecus stercoravium]|uniref:Site-specific integrase n=1 Tax=Candidatus Coprenecus stercoravium TaxID=2840735 RepID=A0A9D2GQV6_9BACT|nr:site-specific integrase [Candidatus Coprenecus stercoravium]